MENKAWGKTILTVYRYLERVTKVFDAIVKTKAEESCHISGANYSINNIFTLSEKILELTERKITLINLKILTEKALSNMNSVLARILILKYIDGRKSDEIASCVGVCRRSIFRKISQGINSFCMSLNRLGYDVKKISNMLSKENWIIETYNQILTTDKQCEVSTDSEVINEQMEDNLFFEFKKIKCFC